ncbi:MAG: FHA domain-containing protein [Candidatus Amulumruptor caecigallinarius]|nr:FHA domain-containing protein [Candidatus Amulumruptor caecigallinarius]
MSKTVIHIAGAHCGIVGNDGLDALASLQEQDDMHRLAGVLITVSRNQSGEIFPLYLGRNVIGSDCKSDVVLREMSVNPQHAVLLLRHIRIGSGDFQIVMSISDNESNNGTYVNEEEVTEKTSIKAYDIIRIGNAYRLLFIPLNFVDYGMCTARNFVSVPEDSRDSEPDIIRLENDKSEITVENVRIPESQTNVGEEYETTFYGRTYRNKANDFRNKTLDK